MSKVAPFFLQEQTVNRIARRLFVALLGVGLVFLRVPQVLADIPATQPAADNAPTTQPAKFIRFVDRGSAGGELDTADVAFTNDKGQTVHLVAAVHIGEHAYYENLAKNFESNDAVLYELVMSKDSAPPAGNNAGEHATGFVSDLQLFLKRSLNLDYQLDVIDYTKPNFVHADLDRETFEKMQADRGESLLSLMIQQALAAWNNPPAALNEDANQQADDLIKLMCRPDGERQFKLLIARQMDDLEAESAGLNGPNGSVILTERNKAAFAVLGKVLAGNKKNIAIFFGAAHMPDMSQRLEAMGFKPTGTTWNMAWNMSVRPDQPSMAERLLRSFIDTSTTNPGH